MIAPQKLHSVVSFKLLGGIEGSLQLDFTNMSLTGPPGRDIPLTLAKHLYDPAEYWIALDVRLLLLCVACFERLMSMNLPEHLLAFFLDKFAYL